MNKLIQSFDERRDLCIPGGHAAAIAMSVDHFLAAASTAIAQKGLFAVALSGGSTPKEIYTQLASEENRNKVDWSRFLVFWSDERNVPPDHPDSNYRMAMEAGFAALPIPHDQIFRMKGEGDIEQHSIEYEALIQKHVPKQTFDLIMLGMGEDGHTASLFPETHALQTLNRLAVANFLPKKNVWRMTLTYDCINAAEHIAIYVLGKNKAPMVREVLTGPYEPDKLPIQKIGTPAHHALWIMDAEAASLIPP